VTPLQLLGLLWNDLLINPMINVTVVLAHVLLNNYGLSIIVFTLVLRAVTLPLTLRQVHSQRKMSVLQPQLNEIQKKYKDPKQKSEATMKLYKEAGANPAGCLLPMIIQFPIWIALYDVIRTVLGSTPESLIDLSGRLYPWTFIQQAVPLGNHFLLWDMGKPDTTYILPVLVGGSMWVQQKLTMSQAGMTPVSQSQAQTNQTLLWMMPLMFGWFTLTVPTGLALYWMITNVIGIIMNYYVFGWKGTSLTEIFLKPATAAPTKGSRAGAGRSARPARVGGGSSSANGDQPALQAATATQAERSRTEKRGVNGRNGRGGSKRKDDRGGDRPGAESTRSGPQPGGGGDS
jgi:YidC/Oxa1 family membrane protein insertase